ncbi:prolyl oligopeptidase family serine peptidase [Sphingosinicella sp.]|uniref:prolyl oligopeptidase family serine peptidase n=1 Tax=Sphingosinicella sp. TaxID=1917971 RepID=UPI004037A11D
MIKKLLLAALVVVAPSALAAMQDEDPYLWLEEIQGQRAIAQVEQWNKATEDDLSQAPGFAERRTRALAILNDVRQIAQPDEIQGQFITNFWRDAQSPRGLWRISPRAAYLAGRPEWRTLIDVDALGRAENRSWVWHGADCLAPEYRRCLVSLSPGGGDADVVREFDIPSGRFVEGGFTLPEAKTNVTWLDQDRLLVATNFGPDSLTESGYARIAKVWRRGTPLAEAQTIEEAARTDISLNPFSFTDSARRWNFLGRGLTFWTSRTSLVTDQGLRPVPIPDNASIQDVLGGRLIVRLNSAMEAGERTLPIGSVVAYSLEDIAAGRPVQPELVMAPTASQAIEEVSAAGGVLWVKALDDVSGRLFRLRRGDDGRWTSNAVALPANSTLDIRATGEDLALVTVESMLTPPALHAVNAAGRTSVVQSLPAQFEASNMSVEQRFARSRDGTRVPYFIVRRRGTRGAVPALIHAYGGFRAAQTPTYLTEQPYRSGPLGLFWVEAGNAYVLANIRGGGEYGPAWHEAALRENRQRSFDDLHAVAEDLVRTGVSTARHIGISGRSNGGVLVGAAANQRPDLYGAVISGSPLTDMRRYHRLLAGASWVGEYGNPDVAGDWAFMSRYSPYQNLRRVPNYPATFYYLSTLDDRVHPGHARKMAARHQELGQRVYYREYREGGHSVGADRTEDATRAALLFAFLTRELGGQR